jgi:hypothetical protein
MGLRRGLAMKGNRLNRNSLRNGKEEGEALKGGTTGYRNMIKRTLAISGAIAGAVFLINAIIVSPLGAQSYPTRPIRLIIPSSPGGGSDIAGRIYARKLTERLGQSVVAENRIGAGNQIAHDFVAKSKPDGYTIVIANPALAMGPSIYKHLNYDPPKTSSRFRLSDM